MNNNVETHALPTHLHSHIKLINTFKEIWQLLYDQAVSS